MQMRLTSNSRIRIELSWAGLNRAKPLIGRYGYLHDSDKNAFLHFMVPKMPLNQELADSLDLEFDLQKAYAVLRGSTIGEFTK